MKNHFLIARGLCERLHEDVDMGACLHDYMVRACRFQALQRHDYKDIGQTPRNNGTIGWKHVLRALNQS